MINLYTMYSVLYHRYVSKVQPTKVSDLSQGRKLMLLGTAPSANEFWHSEELRSKYADHDMVVMNRSIYKMRDEVFRMKPRYFAVADPIYWGEANPNGVDPKVLRETKEQFEDVMNHVDWDCYLITYEYAKIHFHNDHVHVIRINVTTELKDEPMTYRLYASNDCGSYFHNVGLVSLYFGLTFGYKEIGLVGMDFDFFKGVYCDENGEVGEVLHHQYDEKDAPLIHEVYRRGIYPEINGSMVAWCLRNLSDTLASFGQMGIYANYQGAKIINYSPNSMIDCYEKRTL